MEVPQVIWKAGRWHGLNFIKKQCERADWSKQDRDQSPDWSKSRIGKQLIFPNILMNIHQL